MRLAVIGDEVSQRLPEVVRAATGTGFDGVEVRSLENTPPHRLTDEQLDRTCDTLRAAGLAVAGFSPPVFKAPLPRTSADLDAAGALLRHCLDQAVRLGAPHMRVFTFFRDGDPDPLAAARAARQVLDGVDSPLPLVVETGTRSNSPTLQLTLRFLDALGRDDIGVLWDPGNSIFSGWDDLPAPDEYRLGRDRIRHVHVKDPDGTRGYVRLGDGMLDWAQLLAQLAADGYQGWVSLETHWRTGRALTARQRDEPWGEDFSADGYQASVECMRLLAQWRDAAASPSVPHA